MSSKSACSPSHSIDCRTRQGLSGARGIPIGRSGRTSSTGWCRVFASPAALGKIFPRCPTLPDTGEKSSRGARGPRRPAARCVQHHLHGAAARDLTVIITIVKVRCDRRAGRSVRMTRQSVHSVPSISYCNSVYIQLTGASPNRAKLGTGQHRSGRWRPFGGCRGADLGCWLGR